jgi:hypothetical protein
MQRHVFLDRGQRLLSPRSSFHPSPSDGLPKSRAVHGPVHTRWLNQIEIYFSIVQRKALTPNDFSSLADVEDRLLRFQQYYESIAKPQGRSTSLTMPGCGRAQQALHTEFPVRLGRDVTSCGTA